MIDLHKASESKQYCDDLKERCNGLVITEDAIPNLVLLMASSEKTLNVVQA